MTLRARPYAPGDEHAWDDLVAASWNGTFLHARGYLSCVDDRVEDASLVLEDAGGRLVGALPAGVHASDPTMLESHPAVAYGGIVHRGELQGARMVAALESVVERCYHDGWRTLRYKTVPHIYHRIPANDDLYALFRLRALRSRCDVASVIDLRQRPSPSNRRMRSLRKAERAGVQIARGAEHMDALWSVISGRLSAKFGAEPLHDAQALVRLRALFPDRVECVVGLLDHSVAAGVVLLRTGCVDHAQYIAADDRGYRASALDAVLSHCIADAEERGTRYFSFGNSTAYGGRVFNESLFSYKAGFGAGAVVHECYDIALT
jgi:GNAT acetyltransferase-like protein